MPTATFIYALVLCTLAIGVTALDNGMGQLPPMGWSSWNRMLLEVNETAVKDTAQAMIDTGLVAAGYNHINVDAGYLVHERDPATGALVANNTKFPSGMRSLADWLHARGLKLGLYTDLGDGSCGIGPGSASGGVPHYAQDAKTLALDWDAARQSSAEHMIAMKALRCTATAWILIAAQCSGIPTGLPQG